MFNPVELALRITAQARDAAAGIDGTTKKASRMGKVGAAAGKVLATGLLAAGAGALVLANGAVQDEAAASRLAHQLEKTAGATQKQIKANEGWITSQGKALGVADDELRPALAKLSAATHDVGEAQKLASLAMDISAGSGKSLESVTAKLVKIQNGSGAAAAALGIKTKETAKDTGALKAAQISAQTAQIKYNDTVKKFGKNSAEARLASDKLALAHEKIGAASAKVKTSTIDSDTAMKRLAATYGGAAAKAADTTEGKTRRMKLQFSEMGEAIGYKLIPVMLKASEIGLQMADWLEANQKVVAVVVVALGSLLAVTWAVSKAMQAWTAISKVLTVVQWALNAALNANPVSLIILAIVALGVALVVAYKRSETFRNIVNGAFRAVQKVAGVVVDWIKEHWRLLFVIMTGPIGLAVLTIVKHRDRIISAFGAAIGWVREHWQGLLAILLGPFGLAIGKIIEHRDRILTVLGNAIEWVRNHWGTISSLLTAPFNNAVTAAKKVIDTVQGIIDKIRSIPTPKVDLNPFNRTSAPSKAGFVDGGSSARVATGGDTYYIDMTGLLDVASAGDRLVALLNARSKRMTGKVVLL